jgi:tetratricopeptide (TPR) repeat protein
LFDTLRDNSRIIVYVVVVAFVISGGFMGYGAYLNNSGGGGQQPSNPNIIAEVNGEEISQQEYLSMLRQQAPQQNLSSTQVISFRYNILNALIERKLILQQAEEMNIEAEVSEEELNESYNNILEQNNITEEELSENLAEQGYNIGNLKDDIRRSLERSKLITETINSARGDVNVSESEIRNLYEQRYPAADSVEAVEENEETDSDDETQEEDRPAFADVQSDLEEELLQQKRNEALEKWLTDLKDDSEIIINDPVLNAYSDFESGNYEEAAEKFSNLIEEQQSPAFYTYLARSYIENENISKAEETYDKALEEYPENNDLRFNYAQLLVEQDNNQAALEQLKEVSSNAGDNLMTRYQLYMMFSQVGAEKEAEAELKEIQRLSEEMNNNNVSEEEIEEEIEENTEGETDLDENIPAEDTAE